MRFQGNKITSQLFLQPNIVTDRTAAFCSSVTLSGISADMYSEYMWHRDEALFRTSSAQCWGEAQHCWRCKSGAFRPLVCQLLAGTPLTADSLANTESHLWWMAKYMTGFLPHLPRGLHADSKTDPPHRDNQQKRGGGGCERKTWDSVHMCMLARASPCRRNEATETSLQKSLIYTAHPPVSFCSLSQSTHPSITAECDSTSHRWNRLVPPLLPIHLALPTVLVLTDRQPHKQLL